MAYWYTGSAFFQIPQSYLNIWTPEVFYPPIEKLPVSHTSSNTSVEIINPSHTMPLTSYISVAAKLSFISQSNLKSIKY